MAVVSTSQFRSFGPTLHPYKSVKFIRVSAGVRNALLAALLFGASAPLAKILLHALSPIQLAGALYLGSGVGLALWRLARRLLRNAPKMEAALGRSDWPLLIGAIFSGGVVAPVLLMVGLTTTPASSTSLLLNLEGVLTALLAWFAFRENLTAVFYGDDRHRSRWPAAVVESRRLPVFRGRRWQLSARVSAGQSTITSPATSRDRMSGKTPSISALTGAGLLGFLSYGVSLTCFVLALRDLGTARTSAYFSTAPFIGVMLSLLLLREISPFLFWPALLLMILGVWMHLTEHHEHDHLHEALEHEHPHRHDAHHQHEHLLTDPPGEPHTHRHRHKALNHAHAHLPDIHHRHGHR
jgi:drug/metabolite transporter (DMT)-like permease